MGDLHLKWSESAASLLLVVGICPPSSGIPAFDHKRASLGEIDQPTPPAPHILLS